MMRLAAPLVFVPTAFLWMAVAAACLIAFWPTTAQGWAPESYSKSPLSRVFAPAPERSLLRNTVWKLTLDVGLQPGTWMPKRFPGWAASGARLGLNVDVHFTDIPCPITSAASSLLGPPNEIFQLRVCAKSQPSTFVSERGLQNVTFVTGGYSIQRPSSSGRILNEAGESIPPPEGLLRFWLDCPTGAQRHDVTIPPQSRLFFSTGVWDNPTELQRQESEYQKVVDEMNALLLVENNDKWPRQGRRGDNTPTDDDNNNRVLDSIQSFSKKVADSRELERLQEIKERFERDILPPPGSAVADNGVRIAPQGSLVMQSSKGVLGGGFLSSLFGSEEYLILGTFSASPVENDPTDFERLGSIYFEEY